MSGSGEHRTGADAPVGQGARPGDGDTQAAARTAEAIPLLERTLAGYERLPGPGHPNALGSRNNLAAVYQDAGRTAEAIPLC